MAQRIRQVMPPATTWSGFHPDTTVFHGSIVTKLKVIIVVFGIFTQHCCELLFMPLFALLGKSVCECLCACACVRV